MELDVLFSDNHLLAVSKPAGIPTQPSEHHTDNLEDMAKAWVKGQFRKPGAVFLHAVHRLDRPVSGVVLFARTGKALSRLNESMRSRDVRKVYRAVVSGSPVPAAGELRHWLLHRRLHAEVATGRDRGAKLARLSYRTIATRAPYALVEIDLLTGRYHQIRAQFANIGCPVVGDGKYGSPETLPDGGIALHHVALTVRHPVRCEPVIIESPLPTKPPWSLFAC